jgi:hypothetical protein
MINEIESRLAQMPDYFPDVNRDRDHHPPVTGLKLHPLQFKIDVVVV